MLLLRSRSFTAQTTISTDIEIVRDAISTAEKVCRLNPLVISVVPVADVADTWDIIDQVSFLGIGYRLRYRARIVFFDDGIDSEIWSILQFHQINQLRLSSTPQGTLVHELVTMTAPWLVVDQARRTGEQAHREMLSRLKKQLEQA